MRITRGVASNIGFPLLVGAILLLIEPLSIAQAASPSAELEKMFSKMDRQLCQSLSLANCKRLAAKKRSNAKATKSKARSSKSKSAPEKASNKNKAIDSKIASQSKVTGKVAAPEQPVKKLDIPVPVLKPAIVSRETKIPTIPKVTIPIPVEKKRAPEKQIETKVVVLPAPAVVPPQTVPPQVHGMPDGTLVGEACYDSLRKLGVNFTQPTTNVGNGSCSVADAVQVQSMTIGNAVVKLSDQPTFTCGFAFKFASWLKVEASPIVTKATGKAIATFGTGPGYQCRGRNGDFSAKLSEHAFGNAVDIERIKLNDGEIIDVKDAITTGAKFQPALAAMRASACQYFTTVLGPGTNTAHATHFHFDLARRGKKGNHTMCQ